MSAKLFFGVSSVINGTTNEIEPFAIIAASADEAEGVMARVIREKYPRGAVVRNRVFQVSDATVLEVAAGIAADKGPNGGGGS